MTTMTVNNNDKDVKQTTMIIDNNDNNDKRCETDSNKQYQQ